MSRRTEREAKQIEIAERLQMKWLERMEELLDTGEISATGMATLARVLMSNGWNLDPSRLPEGLRDKLKGVELPDFNDEDIRPEEFGIHGGSA